MMDPIVTSALIGASCAIIWFKIGHVRDEFNLKIGNLYAKIAELEDEIDQLRQFYGEEED